MMRRKLNLVFLAGLIGVIAVTGVGAHLVHGFQVKRNLGAVLDRARKTEAAGDLDKTIFYLRRFLVDRPDDGETSAWLARVMDQKTPERSWPAAGVRGLRQGGPPESGRRVDPPTHG